MKNYLREYGPHVAASSLVFGIGCWMLNTTYQLAVEIARQQESMMHMTHSIERMTDQIEQTLSLIHKRVDRLDDRIRELEIED